MKRWMIFLSFSIFITLNGYSQECTTGNNAADYSIVTTCGDTIKVNGNQLTLKWSATDSIIYTVASATGLNAWEIAQYGDYVFITDPYWSLFRGRIMVYEVDCSAHTLTAVNTLVGGSPNTRLGASFSYSQDSTFLWGSGGTNGGEVGSVAWSEITETFQLNTVISNTNLCAASPAWGYGYGFTRLCDGTYLVLTPNNTDNSIVGYWIDANGDVINNLVNDTPVDPLDYQVFGVPSGVVKTVYDGTYGISFMDCDGNEYPIMLPIACGVVSMEFTQALQAEAQNAEVILNWESVNDNLTASINIYRSADGTKFDKIDAVTPENGKAKYYFVDKDPLAGKSYYQLEIVDNNGVVDFSNVASVMMELDENEKASDIIIHHANPIQSNGIFVENVGDTHDLFFIIDEIGRIIFKKDVKAGSKFIINKADLPRGFFYVKTSEITEKVINP